MDAMTGAYFVTHPDVIIDPAIPITEWRLSPVGRRRMEVLLQQPWVPNLGSVWCSSERKAIEAAEIIGNAVGANPRQLRQLGENDRSSTGYLPRVEFEATADAFFANPDRSIRGWETAADAQRRIIDAIATVLGQTQAGPDIVLVSHGAVGALLLCHLRNCPISRLRDQPPGGGGNYFAFDATTRSLRHGWRPIEDCA